MSYYFTNETDLAIIRFNESVDSVEKNKIFDKEIRPALEKLIENLIYVYGFFKIDNVETLQNECLSSLYETLPKFRPDKGSKAFSYFNVVAKNWFIAKIREKAKRARLESELYYDLDHEAVKNDPSFVVSSREQEIEEKEWWVLFFREMESWHTQLTKKSEKEVLDAVIYIMRHADDVSIYNKKAVYLYLREMTGLNTKQVVVNLKKITILYRQWRKKYDQTGETDDGDLDEETTGSERSLC